MIEASVDGEESSDNTREVAVGWVPASSEEKGMIVSMLEVSNREVDRLGRSIVEVVPSKIVLLLGKSSIAGMLGIIASVVIGDETTPLGISVLEAIVSVSVMSTLVESIEED